MTVVYKLLFLLSKICKVLAIFISYYVLRYINSLGFVFITKIIMAFIYFAIQKPFSNLGPCISKNDLLRLFKYTTCSIVFDLLYIEGLYLTGPLRTILLAEHNDTVFISLFSVILGYESSITKSRGVLFFFLGVFSISFLDHDLLKSVGHPEGNHKSNFIHHFYELLINFGLSDHKLGAMLLCVAAFGRVVLSSIFRTLSINVGGSKRLNSLTHILSFILLTPIYVLNVAFGSQSESSVSLSSIIVILIFVSLLLVLDYYITSISVNKFGQNFTSTTSFATLIIFGAIFTLLWPFETMLHRNSTKLSAESHPEHGHSLTFGLIFSLFCQFYASGLLSSPGRQSGANEGPFSDGFLGVKSKTSLNGTSNSIVWHIRHTMENILKESSSRKIFAFLCLNLIFTFVELFYGVWTNSLGLISDGFHMFFDCAALVMGLYASVIGHWPPDKVFSFGYHRAEVLSGFINSLFLIIISSSVFIKAITRLFSPPEILTDRLLFVSIIGLCVNLVGIIALGHAHSHGGQACHGHDSKNKIHSHSHSHEVQNHSHGDVEAEEANLRGVYLHVLADTLGSVGVIISSFLVTSYGLNIADPICSLFIAMIIFASTVPLLQQTSKILLLKAPGEDSKLSVSLIVSRLIAIPDVIGLIDPQLWAQTSDAVCCNLRIRVSEIASEPIVLESVRKALSDFKIHYLTIQIEKEPIMTTILTSHEKYVTAATFAYFKNSSDNSVQLHSSRPILNANSYKNSYTIGTSL